MLQVSLLICDTLNVVHGSKYNLFKIERKELLLTVACSFDNEGALTLHRQTMLPEGPSIPPASRRRSEAIWQCGLIGSLQICVFILDNWVYTIIIFQFLSKRFQVWFTPALERQFTLMFSTPVDFNISWYPNGIAQYFIVQYTFNIVIGQWTTITYIMTWFLNICV